ncbi:1-acyl-sn-glycerol-3-phosphate acyltransferase [Streptomyces sp. NPDC058812]|uniref:1-acyl-sn-glycerol-3-phosphate acyltransferase n=1 Tax=unclassified Streptomyces TaxID=2593676 RepID=UPI0036B72764
MTRHSPEAVVTAVLAQPAASAETARLSRETGRAPDVVRDALRRCLREMAAGGGRRWREAFGRFLQWFVTGPWQVDSRAEERHMVRRLAASGTVIFLPSHRAYADPLFLARVLRDCGLPRNIWFAGDNLRIPLLSTPARRAGVVFVRRRPHGDETYRAALRLYLRYLIDLGQPLEWYPEGSRTRTGLLQPPRLGLLTHALEALGAGTGRQAWFVPVSLTHAPVPGGTELADEEAGRPKRPESLRWFARYVRDHRRAAGRVEVRFAAPLAAGAYGRPAPTGHGAAARRLGRDVNRGIARTTPVTPEALVCLALTSRFAPFSADGVHRRVQPLLDALERWNAPCAPAAVLRDEDGVQAALDRLRRAGAVASASGGAHLVHRPRARVAALYRNQCVHWFWPRAAAEVAALRGSRVDPHAAWEHGVRQLRLVMDLLTCGTGLETDPLLLANAVVELKRLATAQGPGTDAPWAFDRELSDAGQLVAPDIARPVVAAQRNVFRHLCLFAEGREAERAAALEAALSHRATDSLHDTDACVSPQLYAAMLLEAERRGFLGAQSVLLRRGRLGHLSAVLDDLRVLEKLGQQPGRDRERL